MFTRKRASKHYETMVKIRKFDLEAKRAREAGEILGNVHVYVGEEAVATGVCACLERKDYIESTHRGHGHTIAKGAELNPMMAELYGKATGFLQGERAARSISRISVLVCWARTVSLAAASASRSAQRWRLVIKKTGAISVVFFGDGASNRGTFHEAANMAAAWHLPVIFVCETMGSPAPHRIRPADSRQ